MFLIKRAFLVLLSSFSLNQVTAQEDFTSCLSADIRPGNDQQLDSLTGVLLNSLPKGSFYLIGESHTFLANHDLQLSLIRHLHKEGIYNVVNELPHAACFLFNEYLESGNDSLLDQILPRASYRMLKEVRDFNDSLPEEQKVRYFGIDYLDPDWDFINLATSLRMIRNKIPDRGTAADAQISRYLADSNHTIESVKAFNKLLDKTLRRDSLKYQQQFGKYYRDLLLICSNMVNMRGGRDDEIYESFKVFYQNFYQHATVAPGFIAFYGLNHLPKLGSLLQQDEKYLPGKKLIRIALHYYQCRGGWYGAPEKIRDEGFQRHYDAAAMAALRKLFVDNKWNVGVIAGESCLSLTNKKYRKDGLIIFHEYGQRRMQSWKFD